MRTCVVHGRFRGPPLLTGDHSDAIDIAGRGTLTFHPAGLTVEGRQVSQLLPAAMYAMAVAGLGACLWWLYTNKGISFDPEGLGSGLVGFTMIFGGLVRQLPTLEPQRFEIPWRSVGLILIRGRTVRVSITGAELTGSLTFRTSPEEAQRIVAWRSRWWA